MNLPSGKQPAAIVVYDGDCGICTWVVARLRLRLSAPVVPQPYQATDLSALGLTEDQAGKAMYLVDTQSATLFRGHHAFGRWLELAGPLWMVLGRLIRHPPFGWAARAVYALVARYRRFIPGPWRAAGRCAVDSGRNANVYQ